MSEETRARRRTVLVYKAPGTESGYNLESADGSAPTPQKEKLSKYTNLIYSHREAELLEDLAKFLIINEPRCAPDVCSRIYYTCRNSAIYNHFITYLTPHQLLV